MTAALLRNRKKVSAAPGRSRPRVATPHSSRQVSNVLRNRDCLSAESACLHQHDVPPLHTDSQEDCSDVGLTGIGSCCIQQYKPQVRCMARFVVLETAGRPGRVLVHGSSRQSVHSCKCGRHMCCADHTFLALFMGDAIKVSVVAVRIADVLRFKTTSKPVWRCQHHGNEMAGISCHDSDTAASLQVSCVT